jgi:hypothetical protein
MRRLIVAAALALAAIGSVTAAEAAATTQIHASPGSAGVGQAVTFTATFTFCSNGVVSHYFTIDGKLYKGQLSKSGLNGTEKLAISTLKLGKHTISYLWQSTPTCAGKATITYTVAAKAPPSPSPAPRPSPSPSAGPSASPSPSSSPTPVTLTAGHTSSDGPLLGYLGGGLIALTVIAGLVLAVSSRR